MSAHTLPSARDPAWVSAGVMFVGSGSIIVAAVGGVITYLVVHFWPKHDDPS